MRELDGGVAVVTGGASGIGSGLCRAFAREGMRVVVADLDRPAAEKLCAELREGGARALAVETDVSRRASVEALAEATEREFGAVDLVCNNAGVLTGGPLLDATEADWQWLLSVNLMGVVHGSHVFAPRLLERGAGHIVNTASVGGFLSSAEMAIYAATKFAVVGFSEALRAELEPGGVGVSILCPGPIATALPDADRRRPPSLGPSGGTSRVLAPYLEGGMAPDAVGPIVLRGIRANAAYIFTHAAFRAPIAERFERALAAFDAVEA